MKHTKPAFSDEDRRLEVLRQYGVLDPLSGDEALDDLTDLAARICETPMALISLVDEHRLWFKSRVGIEMREAPRENSICEHALWQTDLLIVPDAREDPRFAGNPMVSGEPGIRFYAGAPLVAPDGPVLGSLCVLDHEPRVLTPAQTQALRVLGRQVMTQLELRRQGRELRASEGKLRAIFQAEPECVKLLGQDGTLHEMNAAGLRLFEADSLEAVTGNSLLTLVVAEDRETVRVMLAEVMGGEKRTVQYRIVGLQGTPRWVEMSGVPFHDETNGGDFVLGVSHDITRRKLGELKIQRLNRLYAVSSSVNEAIFRLRDTQQLYEQACRIAVEQGGLVMAWVGLGEPDSGLLRPVARWGRDEGYLDAIQILVTPGKREGQGPGGEDFRRGEPSCCNDIAAAETFASQAEALQRGYRSCAVFPIKLEGHPVGVFAVYGDQTEYFDTEELTLLKALAENISFAVESLQREEARRVSEARYRALFDYAPDGILIADGNSNYIDANASVCRMLGHTRDELLALGARDIVVKSEIPHIGPALDQIKSTSDYHREWQFRRKDGSVFLAEVMATLMPDGNLLGMIRDVTERKLAETRFRRLVDSNAQGVFFWNTKGEITGGNDAYLRIAGYSHEDMANGCITWDAVTPPEYAGLDRRAREEIGLTGTCTPFEKEYIRKDGSRVPVLVGAASFEDTPDEGFCFVLDLTERKKLEQQFLRSQRMESIGTLAGGIAHDLNNVLAPIIMAINLLDIRFPDRDSQELLSIISASARRGADMVRQVLSFARGVEGRRVEVQVKHLIHEVEKITCDTFLKHIEIRTIVAPDLLTVLGDPTQLHQVLLNLCVNARDAMPGGGVLILSAVNIRLDAQYAGLHPEARPGSYICLRVKDTGVGMTAEVIEKIFDPFFTTKEIGKGTGLGLSTSLAIVKSHGGFLRVNSELEKGTTFEVFLPAEKVVSTRAEAEIDSDMPRGNGELILVVDDEDSVREITRQTLETFGYRVLLASDGADAIASYVTRQGEIDVVLTDMMMPVMDGPSAIQVLLTLNPDVRIIAVSGGATLGSDRKGVQEFISKPYTAETLLKALEEVLSRT